jgi:superfamily I DNA/RNA helicase/RecB family exonuclease
VHHVREPAVGLGRPDRDRGDGSPRPGAGPAVRLDRRAPDPAPAPMLDAEQRAVVEHRGGHLLVLAGPGTGKTTTLAELVVRRLLPGPDQLAPESVLALTFGRRAAHELAERISVRLGGGPVPVVATFHSFAYGIVRQHADPAEFQQPPRLLTASEQDARLRELLTHAVEEGRLPWPASLQAAVGTRGIAEQVRRLLTRARGLDLSGADLRRFGRSSGLPAWSAIGRFVEEYADVMDWEGTIDYAALIQRAIGLAADERRGRALREAFRLIVVDEYQDTDPAQVELVRTLAAGGAQVVAVGDPDQAIYGFRGADVGGILRFPETFADPVSGAPAQTIVLRHTRRFRAPIAEAAHGVLGSNPLPGLPAEQVRVHRSPVTPAGEARVEARTWPSQAAEAAGVADVLLRAHAGMAGPALPWSQMAVLVRSPLVSGPVLVRALRAAGVPVAVAPDELALAEQPAVAVLLAVLGLALAPGEASAEAGAQLLAGPLGRVDPIAIRALARAALLEHRAVQGRADAAGAGADRADSTAGRDGALGPTDWGVAPRSGRLLTDALAAGRLPAGADLSPRARAGFARVAGVIDAARTALAEDGLVAEVLWAAWSATDWPERLRRSALAGGPAGESADRDLDALVALFDLANRLPAQRRGRAGLAGFVDDVRALQVPQEAWAPGQVSPDAVRLLSAHRAKGLEWDLVVVAGVQEGAWPDLRLRSDLLHVDELTREGRAPARTARDLLVEERRLMYVACTRARHALVVTAVAEPLDGGLQPSRFLEQLGVPIRAMAARPAAPMDGPGIVTALRAAAAAPVVLGPDGAPEARVEQRRAAAIARLAALARHAGAAGGGPLAAARPETWWGVRAVTGGAVDAGSMDRRAVEAEVAALEPAGPPPDDPLADPSPDDPLLVRLSPSAVEQLRRCPLQWFLERRVKAGTPAGAPATIGTIVHEVARAIADGEVAPDMAAIGPYVDGIWAGLPFPARYQSGHERERLDSMLRALLRWLADNPRGVLHAEAGFELELATETGGASVRGSIDRVERDADGRLHLVDFKTGKTAASQAATEEHAQLGVYQLSVREGGLADVPADDVELGGAELVHLGATYADGRPKVRVQAPLPAGETWVHEVVADAARLAAGPGYPARRNSRCTTCAFRHMCPVLARGGAAGTADPASGGGA